MGTRLHRQDICEHGGRPRTGSKAQRRRRPIHAWFSTNWVRSKRATRRRLFIPYRNGTGKARAARDGALREPKSWRALILSSGEIPTETKLREDKSRRARAGQLVRMLDIPADRGAGCGAFDHAGQQGDPAKLAATFKHAATSNYGTAGPEFVRRLIADQSTAKPSTSDGPNLFPMWRARPMARSIGRRLDSA